MSVVLFYSENIFSFIILWIHSWPILSVIRFFRLIVDSIHKKIPRITRGIFVIVRITSSRQQRLEQLQDAPEEHDTASKTHRSSIDLNT